MCIAYREKELDPVLDWPFIMQLVRASKGPSQTVKFKKARVQCIFAYEYPNAHH